MPHSFPMMQWEPERDPARQLQRDIVAEPLVGWRMWRVQPPNGTALTADVLREMADRHDRGENPFRDLLRHRLGGVGVSHTWQRVEKATCGGDGASMAGHGVPPGWKIVGGAGYDHPAPHQTCMCGLWAFKELAGLIPRLAGWGPGGPRAYGQVQMWGRVFEHEHGYRAEHARPLALTLAGGNDEIAADLRAVYGCEVTVGKFPPEVEAHQKQLAERQSQALQLSQTWALNFQNNMIAGNSASVGLTFTPFSDCPSRAASRLVGVARIGGGSRVSSAAERLSVGYQPNFDIDAAVGRDGERYVANIIDLFTCAKGSHPTKGVLVALSVLVPWCMEARS